MVNYPIFTLNAYYLELFRCSLLVIYLADDKFTLRNQNSFIEHLFYLEV